MKEAWTKWFRRDNLLILILSGVLLFIIVLPTGDGNSAKKQKSALVGTQSVQENVRQQGETETQGNEVSELEKRLEGVISQMAGIGKVKVMITLQSSEELIVEKDEPMARSNTNETDSAGGSRLITQMDSAPSTVFRTVGNDSEPYVVKTLSPKVEGVVVVAQGAGNGTVDKNITEMVQALFGVEAHKVKVVKMAQSK